MSVYRTTGSLGLFFRESKQFQIESGASMCPGNKMLFAVHDQIDLSHECSFVCWCCFDGAA